MQDPSALITDAYEKYADAIFRHCYLRLMNRARGQEIMQEAFLKAFEYSRKGAQIDNIRALLYRIANNLIIDDVRKRKEMSLDALAEAGYDPKGEGEQDVVRPLEEERVLSTLALLPKEDSELIVMRFIDELKPQEIGKILDLPANTISVRLHRALKELKTHLKNP